MFPYVCGVKRERPRRHNLKLENMEVFTVILDNDNTKVAMYEFEAASFECARREGLRRAKNDSHEFTEICIFSHDSGDVEYYTNSVIRHTILHESALAARDLCPSDRRRVVSFVRPFANVDGHTASTISQYTFLNGYYYAAHGAKGLDNEFLEWDITKLQNFIKGKSIASELFKSGMALHSLTLT